MSLESWWAEQAQPNLWVMANPKCLGADGSVSSKAKNKQTQPHFYLPYFQNIVFDFFFLHCQSGWDLIFKGPLQPKPSKSL